MIWIVVILMVLGFIGMIIEVNEASGNGAGAAFLFLIFIGGFIYTLNYSMDKARYVDTDWYTREISSERDSISSESAKLITKENKDKKVWAILNRDTWDFERGYTYKEADERRQNLYKKGQFQTRLFLETDNLNEVKEPTE